MAEIGFLGVNGILFLNNRIYISQRRHHHFGDVYFDVAHKTLANMGLIPNKTQLEFKVK